MKIILIIALLFSTPVFAGYNANYKSVITGVYVYSGGDHIYITLEERPTTACSNDYFVVDASVPEGRRHMLLSRLLLAYASKEKVNIGYDREAGDCVNSYVRIHRVG